MHGVGGPRGEYTMKEKGEGGGKRASPGGEMFFEFSPESASLLMFPAVLCSHNHTHCCKQLAIQTKLKGVLASRVEEPGRG